MCGINDWKSWNTICEKTVVINNKNRVVMDKPCVCDWSAKGTPWQFRKRPWSLRNYHKVSFGQPTVEQQKTKALVNQIKQNPMLKRKFDAIKSKNKNGPSKSRPKMDAGFMIVEMSDVEA